MTSPAGDIAGRAAVQPPGSAPALGAWAVAATVAGNALEFYDFLTYATFAVYIGKAFFPAGDPFANLLLSLATFGVGFLTRPLGGLLIGAYADRAGRRPALTLTIALMSVGTLALVLTPTYAAIGAAAPVILVLARLVQGLALGGEVGPSTAVLLECAAPGRAGWMTSWQAASQGIAILAAGLVGLALAQLLGPQQLADWGWRIAFALGLAIVPVGVVIRRRLPETLERHVVAAGAGAEARTGASGSMRVLRALVTEHGRVLGLAILVIMSLTISTYVNNYMTTYALTTLGMPASEALWATLVNGAVIAGAARLGGHLSDRRGRRLVMIAPRALLILVIYPAFLFLVGAKSLWALVGVTALLTALSSLSAAAALAAVTEVFPNAVRSSGLAVSYALAVSLFGGTTQFVVAWLTHATGDPMSPAFYVILSSAASLWAMWRLPVQSPGPGGA
jgi:MFS family permease